MSDNWEEELNICLLQRGVVIYTSDKCSYGEREREHNCKGCQYAWSAGNIGHVLHFFCLHMSFLRQNDSEFFHEIFLVVCEEKGREI